MGYLFLFLIAAGSSLLQPTETHLLLNEKLTLLPIENHHFNLKAPQTCGPFSFETKTPQKLVCQMTKAGEQNVVTSICDDKETFCTQEKIKISVADRGGNVSAASRAAIDAKDLPKTINESGWIENNWIWAFEKAKAEKKFVLVDFYGEWCPPCNALDEMVFHSDVFRKDSADVVKVRVDIDQSTTAEIQQRFRVYNYPTLVLADSNQEEIARRLDYNFQDPKVFVNWLVEAQKNKIPLTAVEKIIQSGKATETEIERVGRWRMERRDYALAQKVFSHSKTLKGKKLLLKAKLRDEGDSSKIYKELIANYSRDIEFADWVLNLAELQPKENHRKNFLEALLAVEFWLSKTDEEIQREEWARPFLLEEKALVLEKLGRKEEMKSTYLLAAQQLETVGKKSPLKKARGPNMTRAYYLMQAEDFNAAKTLLAELASEYGDEYTFNFRYAKVLFKTKDYRAALPYADKAIQNSYGPNKLYSVALKGDILSAMGKKAEAKKLLEDELSKVVLPKDPKAGLHYAIKTLRESLRNAKS